MSVVYTDDFYDKWKREISTGRAKKEANIDEFNNTFRSKQRSKLNVIKEYVIKKSIFKYFGHFSIDFMKSYFTLGYFSIKE